MIDAKTIRIVYTINRSSFINLINLNCKKRNETKPRYNKNNYFFRPKSFQVPIATLDQGLEDDFQIMSGKSNKYLK